MARDPQHAAQHKLEEDRRAFWARQNPPRIRPPKPQRRPRAPEPVYGSNYERRDGTLLAMGFKSYADYLQSPLWRQIRTRALDRDGGRCVRCGHAANQVHHLNYSEETMRGRKPASLVSVCRDCHEHAEFANGSKTTLVQANERLGLPGMVPCRRCSKVMSWTEFVLVPHIELGRNQPLFDYCKRCRKVSGFRALRSQSDRSRTSAPRSQTQS